MHLAKTRSIGVNLFCLALCFCGGAGENRVLAQSQPAGPAATSFDGDYAGIMTMTQNNARTRNTACLGGPFQKTLSIRRGQVSFTYNGTYDLKLMGTVAGDGSVTAFGTSPPNCVSSGAHTKSKSNRPAIPVPSTTGRSRIARCRSDANSPKVAFLPGNTILSG